MQKKNKWVGLILLWGIFLSMTGFIIYVSFQNGTDTKEIGKQVIEYIAQLKFPEGHASENQLQQLTYDVRQFGRVAAFFMLGIVGTVTIHVSCRRCCWVIKTGIASMILVAIAYFTEKFKVYIPTRHYNYEEMLFSVVAVVGGFLLVSLITFMLSALRGFFRLVTAVH